MDPNATWELYVLLRGLCTKPYATGDDYTAMEAAWSDLENWIARGGFSPAAWAGTEEAWQCLGCQRETVVRPYGGIGGGCQECGGYMTPVRVTLE